MGSARLLTHVLHMVWGFVVTSFDTTALKTNPEWVWGLNSSNADPHGAMAWTVGPLSMYHRRSLDTGTNVYAGHPVCDIADAGWDGGRGTWITAGVGWAAWLHAGTVQYVSADPACCFESRVR